MTHIGKKSTLQTVCRFGFLFSINQFGFGFFQFRNIIVYTDKLYYTVFRLILIDYHIGAHPIPLSFRPRMQNTYLSLEVSYFSKPCLIKKIQNPLSVIRVHFTIYTYNIRQRRIFIFSHILIPLLNGIAFPIQQVRLCITYFCIIRNQQEEVLKITNTVQSIHTLGIIDIDKGISGKVTLTII